MQTRERTHARWVAGLLLLLLVSLAPTTSWAQLELDVDGSLELSSVYNFEGTGGTTIGPSDSFGGIFGTLEPLQGALELTAENGLEYRGSAEFSIDPDSPAPDSNPFISVSGEMERTFTDSEFGPNGFANVLGETRVGIGIEVLGPTGGITSAPVRVSGLLTGQFGFVGQLGEPEGRGSFSIRLDTPSDFNLLGVSYTAAGVIAGSTELSNQITITREETATTYSTTGVMQQLAWALTANVPVNPDGSVSTATLELRLQQELGMLGTPFITPGTLTNELAVFTYLGNTLTIDGFESLDPNVEMRFVVPEPGTALCLLVGLMGLAARRGPERPV